MNDADLVAAAHAAFNPYVLEQLSSRIGLPPDAIRHVVERAAPAIVLTMMASASSAESAQRLFLVIMSTESNARIAAQLAGLTASSHGLKAVERSGHELAIRIAESREIALISDHIAALTSVPPQAAHALTDVASAVVFGAAKHHMLLEQGCAGDLPGLLAYQWPIAAPWLAEGYSKALGFESSAAFADRVPQQLVGLAAAMPRVSATAGNGSAGWATNGAPSSADAARSGAYSGGDPYGLAGGAAGAAAARAAPGVPTQLLTTVEPSAPRSRRVPVWAWGILVVIVLLIGIILYGYRQRTGTDEGSAQLTSSTASGTLSAVAPVSGASVPPAAQAAADSGASGMAAASEAVASSEAASATGAAAVGGSPASSANPASAASQ
ncbi:hypothetical protein PPGU19_043300 [Paraburkholderia sp. PGU19]|uniref:DUF937 domain-containing protein n=1 Tax=Paraburkholderia sp. PGU19 TaxID=2735434 RepID=UPI0015DA44D3|nr:DUF937 domain-containing protein [Paraburkholderia sp. PGU19]BCF99761.1 hypothetical protein PPGU19_043300 [Paraburkholderia sp. PGU19]